MAVDAIGGVTSSSAYTGGVTTQPDVVQVPKTRTVEAPAATGEETGEYSPAGPANANGFEVTDSGKVQNQAADTTEALKKAVDEINSKASNSEAQFSVHEGTNRIMVKIVDKETKKVIKEFPPEKTLDMIAKAWELAGLTVDERR
ncbi:MAG: flagellar protein FlaG [Eubacterium sp.]|nr:flagellar protein FlaG [Eubacterium sp.]